MEIEKEFKITYVLKNFIDELSRGYDMSDDEKEYLEKLAVDDINKLYNQKEK